MQRCVKRWDPFEEAARRRCERASGTGSPIPDPPNKGLVHCGPPRGQRLTPLATPVMPCTLRILPANPAVQWDSNGALWRDCNGAAWSSGVRSSFPVKSVIKNKEAGQGGWRRSASRFLFPRRQSRRRMICPKAFRSQVGIMKGKCLHLDWNGRIYNDGVSRSSGKQITPGQENTGTPRSYGERA